MKTERGNLGSDLHSYYSISEVTKASYTSYPPPPTPALKPFNLLPKSSFSRREKVEEKVVVGTVKHRLN